MPGKWRSENTGTEITGTYTKNSTTGNVDGSVTKIADAGQSTTGDSQDMGRGNSKDSSSGDTGDVADDSDIVIEESFRLKRSLGLTACVAYIVGSIIGSGIFVSPAGVITATGSVGLSLIIWALCGLIGMAGALSFCELGCLIPLSGQSYHYLIQAFHPSVGFMFAFTRLWMMFPSSFAIICLVCAEYVMALFFSDVQCGTAPQMIVRFVALLVALFLVGLNMMSVKYGKAMAYISTTGKLGALLLIILVGFVRIGQGHTDYLSNPFEGTKSSPVNIALAFYSGFWAYGGWDSLNFMLEEVKDPIKNLPRAIWISVPLVTVVYVATIVAYHSVLSPQDMIDSNAVAMTWANYAMPKFAWLMPLTVAVSTFGAANSDVFVSSRLAFCAGREGHMVNLLSMIHVKAYTPLPAALFHVILSGIMIFSGGILDLINWMSFTASLFNALTMAALLWLRYKWKHVHRPYKVNLVFPIFTLLINVYVVIVPLVFEPAWGYVYALLVMLSSLVLYFLFVYKQYVVPGTDWVTCLCQRFLQVAPTDGVGVKLPGHED